MGAKCASSKRSIWSQKRWLRNSSGSAGTNRVSTVPWYHSAKARLLLGQAARLMAADRKSTRLNSSHVKISYAVFCLKKKKEQKAATAPDGRNNTTKSD